VHASDKNTWQSLFDAANHHVSQGVVDANNIQRNRYWRHWCNFLWPHFDPFLQNLSHIKQISVLQAFAKWVRQGKAGRGHQIRAGTVQEALSAIGKTFELAGLPNPLYQPNSDKFEIHIRRQLEAFRRIDPPSKPQLAVPVAIPNWIYQTSRQSKNPHIRAIGELSLMAFFFLLHVGEYTHNNSTRNTRTKPFRLSDVVFYHKQNPIRLQGLQHHPSLPDLVRLKIDNQKNGKRDQIVSHHAIQHPCCPVKACTARILTLLKDGATNDTLICAYRTTPKSPFSHVSNDDIVQAVRLAVQHHKTATKGYTANDVGSHSLRAGGAMALFLHGVNSTTIMKLGCWTSTAFMSYIHEQVDIISKDTAQKMATDTSFTNLAVSPPLSHCAFLQPTITTPNGDFFPQPQVTFDTILHRPLQPHGERPSPHLPPPQAQLIPPSTSFANANPLPNTSAVFFHTTLFNHQIVTDHT